MSASGHSASHPQEIVSAVVNVQLFTIIDSFEAVYAGRSYLLLHIVLIGLFGQHSFVLESAMEPRSQLLEHLTEDSIQEWDMLGSYSLYLQIYDPGIQQEPHQYKKS